MIASRDSTAETMLRALAHTLGALGAAAELDVDRTDEDRQFFTAEHDTLQPLFDGLFKGDRDATEFDLLQARPKQARVVIGDAVLDSGVSRAKARMKVELKGSAMPDGADHVFGKDVSEIINAERVKEPAIVLQAVGKLAQVPDFTGKPVMEADLTARATKQKQNFADRDEATVNGTTLDGAVKLGVAAGADALYRLEKRLLERFPRETRYVKAFFLDVAAPRNKAEATPGAATPATPPAGDGQATEDK